MYNADKMGFPEKNKVKLNSRANIKVNSRWNMIKIKYFQVYRIFF